MHVCFGNKNTFPPHYCLLSALIPGAWGALTGVDMLFKDNFICFKSNACDFDYALSQMHVILIGFVDLTVTFHVLLIVEVKCM